MPEPVTATDRPLRVVVAVLTFHRPAQIVTTVQLVRRQLDDLPADVDAQVLVVDNDPLGSGRDAVAPLGLERVRTVVEPSPGIAAARNRALDEADGDLLLFLDDDGEPADDWLRRMVAAWRRTEPAAVAGWVDTHFTGAVDPWIQAGRFFARRRWEDGRPLPAAACGNLLLDLHQVQRLRFNPGTGLSGGEDTLFTRSLVARGGRIVFCHDAVVVDQVDPQRTTRRWVLARSFSHGNTGAIIDMHLASSRTGRVRTAAAGAVRVLAGAARAGVGLARRDLTDQARGARLVARGLGMLAATAGLSYLEYAPAGSLRDRFVAIPGSLAPRGFQATTEEDR